jgi:adenine C2-methylase RlmN of 23S rRNA A2503 and tRNA A37
VHVVSKGEVNCLVEMHTIMKRWKSGDGFSKKRRIKLNDGDDLESILILDGNGAWVLLVSLLFACSGCC